MKKPDSSSQRVFLKNFYGGHFAKWVADYYQKQQSPTLLITENRHSALQLAEELKHFGAHKTCLFPNVDIIPFSGISAHKDFHIQILRNLFTVLHDPKRIFIIPYKTLTQKRVGKNIFQKDIHKIDETLKLTRQDFIDLCIELGYEKSPLVEDVGQFAIRGDICDVFSPASEHPIRLSLFDDEIESIKAFDLVTQKTTETVSHFFLIPSHEILFHRLPENWDSHLKKKTDAKLLSKDKRDPIEEKVEQHIYFHGIENFLPLLTKETSSLLDYFPKNITVISHCDLALDEKVDDFFQEITSKQNQSGHIETIQSPDELFLDSQNLRKDIAGKYFTTFPENCDEEIVANCDNNLLIKQKLQTSIQKLHNLEPLVAELNEKRKSGYACQITSTTKSGLERLTDLLKRFDLPLATTPENTDSRLVHITESPFLEGYIDHDQKHWWITETEIFGNKVKRRVLKDSQRSKEATFSNFSEIHDGDFIIHIDHGVGIYKGLTQLSYDPNQNDFLTIEYLGGDKLYVPVDKLNLVQRYVAEEGSTPQIDKLGGTTWKKVRKKAKKAARKLAAELLKLQAERELQVGHQYKPHHDEILEFSSSFGFEETPDQLSAIEAVYQDMESKKPMDRLVCGDVGFGKTEVAIRAAYKAALEHKQVALLVPTTVLAFQHYTTFAERFQNYPVNVDLLSRFRTASEQKKILFKLKTGEIDIVIGTHRLLSKDIQFRDLGLLIIDEEHRFGVVHKEKIKKLKSLVDVMTLTATPIPRTLNFALHGIRDLSLITTPPVDRLAIKTHTCSLDPDILQDVMNREIKRGGQIYFVHNRVQSIQKVTAQIKEWLPDARVRFAHGQMEEGKLEEIMLDFMQHKFDVLVCTTIIESGVDIPNANTMIINRADTFGLAQLYQLRGRVGRSNRQAYCYLVVPSKDMMTTKAKKRLTALQRFTELGSGFRIASHDLEIRGAGNILGDEQSGHIAAIGYDMYVHLLKEAIAELQNQDLPQGFEPEILLNVTAKIPKDFIPDDNLRLVLYKELSSSESYDEVSEIQDEWIDRFGKLPEETKNLFALIRLKLTCKKLFISSLKGSGDKVLIEFHQDHNLDTGKLIELVQKNSNKYSVTKDGRFVINIDSKKIFEEITVFLSSLYS